MSRVVNVIATWDQDAKVWVAESEDVPGLITEAATQEEMIQKLRDIVPELLEENDGSQGMPEIPLSLMWKQLETLRLKLH